MTLQKIISENRFTGFSFFNDYKISNTILPVHYLNKFMKENACINFKEKDCYSVRDFFTVQFYTEIGL